MRLPEELKGCCIMIGLHGQWVAVLGWLARDHTHRLLLGRSCFLLLHLWRRHHIGDLARYLHSRDHLHLTPGHIQSKSLLLCRLSS